MVQNSPVSKDTLAIFENDLATWGPGAPPLTCDLEFARAYCRRISRSHYENFTVVSLLLPRNLRQDFSNFYAYCRWSDDLADETPSDQREHLLDWWSDQLESCYSARPSHPIMVALQSTIQRHRIDREPLADLLSAFRQDQHKRRYTSDEEVEDYCQRSANPVGRVILRMARADSPQNVALSDAICTGLQVANFCQDMARDAAIDRIYMPRDRWQAHSVTECMILEARSTEPLVSALRDWVRLARNYFIAGRPLVGQVPKWLAVDIDLFIRGGLAILNAIEQQGYDVWTRRPVVSKLTKFKLLLGSVIRTRTNFGSVEAPLPLGWQRHG